MAAVATREPHLREPDAKSDQPPAQRLFDPAGPTLEDAILATWDELATAGHAVCPVCGGEMARAAPCESCDSELA